MGQSDGVGVMMSREELLVHQGLSIQSPAVLDTVPFTGAEHPHLSLGQTLRGQLRRRHWSWRTHSGRQDMFHLMTSRARDMHVHARAIMAALHSSSLFHTHSQFTHIDC